MDDNSQVALILGLVSVLATIVGAFVPVVIHLIERPRHGSRRGNRPDGADTSGALGEAEGSRIRKLSFLVAAVFFALAIGALVLMWLTTDSPDAASGPPAACIRSVTRDDDLPILEVEGFVDDVEEPFELFVAVNVAGEGYFSAIHIDDPPDDHRVEERVELPDVWVPPDVYLLALRIEDYPSEVPFNDIDEALYALDRDSVLNLVPPQQIIANLTMDERDERCDRGAVEDRDEDDDDDDGGDRGGED